MHTHDPLLTWTELASEENPVELLWVMSGLREKKKKKNLVDGKRGRLLKEWDSISFRFR